MNKLWQLIWGSLVGLELSIAKKQQELYQNLKIALIKYAKGGTGLDSIAGENFGSWQRE